MGGSCAVLFKALAQIGQCAMQCTSQLPGDGGCKERAHGQAQHSLAAGPHDCHITATSPVLNHHHATALGLAVVLWDPVHGSKHRVRATRGRPAGMQLAVKRWAGGDHADTAHQKRHRSPLTIAAGAAAHTYSSSLHSCTGRAPVQPSTKQPMPGWSAPQMQEGPQRPIPCAQHTLQQAPSCSSSPCFSRTGGACWALCTRVGSLVNRLNNEHMFTRMSSNLHSYGA